MIAALAILLVVLVVVFSVAFLFARSIENYGVVDVVWSYAFLLAAVVYATVLEAWSGPSLILLTMVALWSGRLGTHLFLRVRREHPREDRRYEDLRRNWKEGFARKMFFFFQAQAVSVVVLALPFLLVLRDPPGALGWAGVAGLILWGTGLLGETLADRQLSRFKKTRKKADGDAVCREGLWRYSRHPNYFFEWLIWIGFALFAFQSEWGWLGLLSPAIIFYLITRVSGIPATEEAALRSKGDAYRHYQKTTNAFFLWPPRSA